MYINPILTKSEERREHYKPFTWSHYLTLKHWAEKYVNDHPCASVCLVGSVLMKEVPRDVDISIIYPIAEYEKMYGEIPNNHEELKALMGIAWYKNRPIWGEIMRTLQGQLWIDLKICPDVWFADTPRLKLA